MVRLPTLVKCEIRVFLEPTGLGDENSFACELQEKVMPVPTLKMVKL